ncbi:MAG TPA: glycosyltransferase family 4 protein [Oleiagrimonas sp.]|nr:glycosyltransferase family 4 protein [Oleiagrimonas sp.]
MNTSPLQHKTLDTGVSQVEEPTLVPHDVAGARGKGNIRLLVFTSLYPNTAQPRHGVFVEERLRHLVDSGRVTATVVAPVPWFPSRNPCFGRYSVFARVPAREVRYGIEIVHPRYPVIPKVGMNVAAKLMCRAMLPLLRKHLTCMHDFDLVDAHYFYPDGATAARLAQVMGKPVVISARGSDVNDLPNYRRPREQIQSAAQNADAIITVSRMLKSKLAALDVDPDKITVLRNGVDLDRFAPRDRNHIRRELRLSGPVWLTVGHLVERKGVYIAVEALARVPDTTLLIAGDGPNERRLHDLVERLGLSARVRFLGPVRHDELCRYYNAADALIHASASEGMPNVVLESLACGTPVVAAPYDGVEELLDTPESGEVATLRSVEAIASAWQRLLERAPSRAATRKHGEKLGWASVINQQCALYARVMDACADTGQRKAQS